MISSSYGSFSPSLSFSLFLFPDLHDANSQGFGLVQIRGKPSDLDAPPFFSFFFFPPPLFFFGE